MSSGMNTPQTTYQRVQQAASPQHGMLALATALDEIKAMLAPLMQPQVILPADPWGEWVSVDTEGITTNALKTVFVKPDNRAQIVDGDVIVKPVSQQRINERYSFATVARLSEFYGPSLSEEDFLAAYAKGGPRWLVYTNRECVMQMPRDLRQQLVADVELDSPEEAAEISRDILKVDESVPEGTQIDWQRAARDLGPLA